MNVNRISRTLSRADIHERRTHHERRPRSRAFPRADARGRRNRVMNVNRISPQAFSRRSEARVLALSPTRTFTKGARIMSVNHILARFPARTLAEGGIAS